MIHQSKSVEWYTPARYIEAARACMGSIDLDPASCFEANLTVKAAKYLTAEQNGLRYVWRGNIWLNPPYGREFGKTGRSNQMIWTRMLIKQYRAETVKQAVLLVNGQPAEKWFQPLWYFHICLTDHRIRFEGGDQPTHGNALVGFGIPFAKFQEHFKAFGECIPSRQLRDQLTSMGYWSL